MRSESELRQRIEGIYDSSERLHDLDFFSRLWLADYAANADIVADCLLEILDGAAVPACMFGQRDMA